VSEGSDQDGATLPGPSLVRPEAMSALLKELLRQDAAPGPATFVEPGPGVMVGRFELVKELGRGGFGVVFEARDVQLRRSVAVKLLRVGGGGLSEQLEREAELVARLSHPNLVTIFDVGLSEHGPYLVLELLQGQTLQQRLEGGTLGVAEAVRVAVEVARGLAYAHGEGVVHRDLKPSNVFLTATGAVKLLDFGMAHAFGRRRVSGGTPAYMAPEQWEEAPEDERTDVFALGVMLHRMLTGEFPYAEQGGRWSSGGAEPRWLEVAGGSRLGPVVASMLAPAARDRPRDGAELLQVLEAVKESLPREPSPPTAKLRWPTRRPPLKRWLVAAGVAALVAASLLVAGRLATPPDPPSVAVLPFADMSPGRDQEYFADGVAEEILNALAALEGLRVPGRISSFWFKGKSVQLSEIGRKLGVVHVLEGSVRRDGNRLRVTAQLTKVADGYYLWSQTFDRPQADLFKVQDEVAQAVVKALRLKLLPGSGLKPPPSRTTTPAVHDLVFMGRSHLHGPGTEDSLRLAVQIYEKAVALDPGHAPAWAGLSESVLLSSENAGTLEGIVEGKRRALAAAEEAIALDPALADGFRVRAMARQDGGSWDFAGAVSDLDRSYELSPSNVEVLRSRGALLKSFGRLREALELLDRATRIDPLSSGAWILLGRARLSAGDHDAARAALERARSFVPDSVHVWFGLGEAQLLEGQLLPALATFGRVPHEAWRLAGEAMALHELGREAEAAAALRLLVSRFGHNSAFQIAEVHAWRGELDKAFDWLDRAHEQGDGGLTELKVDPLLRKLRGDRRFQEVLRKLRLPVD
jgi:serine/threonine protein kinase/Tfp pilus assembly protein PilF